MGQDYNTGLHCLWAAPAERNSSEPPRGLSSLWKYLALLVLFPPSSLSPEKDKRREGGGREQPEHTRLAFWPLIVSAEGLARSSENTSDCYVLSLAQSALLFRLRPVPLPRFHSRWQTEWQTFDSPADDTSSTQQKAESHPACRLFCATAMTASQDLPCRPIPRVD